MSTKLDLLAIYQLIDGLSNLDDNINIQNQKAKEIYQEIKQLYLGCKTEIEKFVLSLYIDKILEVLFMIKNNWEDL